MDNDIKKDARRLWDYMVLGQQSWAADVLLVLGSIDDRVARRAAELSKQYRYKHIIFTGGVAHANDLLLTKRWTGTEADHFYAMFLENGGVGSVLLETRARNTGENALYSFELLKTTSIANDVRSIQVVTKPYMERRALATFMKQWPEPQPIFYITSPELMFDNYCDDNQPFEMVINIMMGDMQRIIEYPERGFQTEQVIPKIVMDAYDQLVIKGFTRHLMK